MARLTEILAETGTHPLVLETSASLTCLASLLGGRPLAQADLSSYEVELKSKQASISKSIMEISKGQSH